MLTEERHQQILSLLQQHSIVKSQELMQLLDASESTVRRDLQELEDEGLLERIHGGAKVLQNLTQELSLKEKTVKNVQQKTQIGELASREVLDGDTIYLDAGSTTLSMIPFLKDKGIIAVTNSVRHAAELVELAIPTIILGGGIKLSTNAVLGSNAITDLKRYRINKAFLGMNGVHRDFGYTTPDPEEAALKRCAIEQSEETFVLVDHNKFNQVTFVEVGKIEEATIITDSCPAEDLAAFAKMTQIKEADQ